MYFRILLSALFALIFVSCRSNEDLCPPVRVEGPFSLSENSKTFNPLYKFKKLTYKSSTGEWLYFFHTKTVEEIIREFFGIYDCDVYGDDSPQEVFLEGEENTYVFSNDEGDSLSISIQIWLEEAPLLWGETKALTELTVLDIKANVDNRKYSGIRQIQGLGSLPYMGTPSTVFTLPFTTRNYYDVYEVDDFFFNKKYGVVSFGDFALMVAE